MLRFEEVSLAHSDGDRLLAEVSTQIASNDPAHIAVPNSLTPSEALPYRMAGWILACLSMMLVSKQALMSFQPKVE